MNLVEKSLKTPFFWWEGFLIGGTKVKFKVSKSTWIFLPISAGLVIYGTILAVTGHNSPSPSFIGGATLFTLIMWNRVDMLEIRKDIKNILSRLDKAGMK